MRISSLKPSLIFIILMLSLTINLEAMGSRENTSDYKQELQQEFNAIIDDIYRGEIKAGSAKTRLKELRTKHNISYTDEAGILDAIIDRAEERSLSYDEARFYFGLLQDGKLMEYRKESSRQKSEQYFREILAMLQQKVESVRRGDGSADELPAILNNYYDLVGLEYDEQYFNLNNMIISLKDGSITSQEMLNGLNSMDQQQDLSSAQQQSQNSRQTSSQSSNQPVSQESAQQEPGLGVQDASEHPSNSETGSQKPQKTGSGSNR